MTTELMSTSSVAKMLGVHYETVRRWIVAGKLKAVRLGTSERAQYRIAYDDVLLFLHDVEEDTDA